MVVFSLGCGIGTGMVRGIEKAVKCVTYNTKDAEVLEQEGMGCGLRNLREVKEEKGGCLRSLPPLQPFCTSFILLEILSLPLPSSTITTCHNTYWLLSASSTVLTLVLCLSDLWSDFPTRLSAHWRQVFRCFFFFLVYFYLQCLAWYK